jgi:hypothetical protein
VLCEDLSEGWFVCWDVQVGGFGVGRVGGFNAVESDWSILYKPLVAFNA